MTNLNSLVSGGPMGLYSQPPAQYASLLELMPPVVASVPWIGVRQRFEQFHKNVSLTQNQIVDGVTKRNGVVNCLNRRYYNSTSTTDNSFLVGSWGKNTATRPPRDVDVFFVIRFSDYTRFQEYAGNRQSALLQEVKGVLQKTYRDTEMSGDGQVVVVRFGSYSVEVVPAILLASGQYWICNTHDGGSYKTCDPKAEISHIAILDQVNNGNLRPLIRMLKAWQTHCSVPIKSFHLELLAADFLSQSPWRLQDYFWFDWICRDFFLYLYHHAGAVVIVPGTQERMNLGNEWQSRAESAWRRAFKACEFEKSNAVYAAGEEWQKIFGDQIPRTV